MKKHPKYLRQAGIWFTFAFTVFGASCEKNDIDKRGWANLKVVNASAGSEPQTFYLAADKLVENGLSFGQATEYLQAYSGSRLSAEFRNVTSGETYANSEVWLYKNEDFTILVYGNPGKAKVKVFNDDLSAPDIGKAKVKFVHLSEQAPSDINLRDEKGHKFIQNISRTVQSSYQQMDPGILTFTMFGTADGKELGIFKLAGIEKGGVYIVVLSGNGSGQTQAILIRQK